MTLTSPLDIIHILIFDVAGSVEIATFLLAIIVSIAMAKFGLTSKIALPAYVLFAMVMATYMEGLYVLAIVLAGLVTFYSIKKVVT